MNHKIIPIGEHCNISFVLTHLKLKKESTLFEWLWSKKISSITNIINNLNDNLTSYDIIINDRTILLNNGEIVTSHYQFEDYKLIWKRRVNRFINDIMVSKFILFIRICYDEKIVENEVIEFVNSIKTYDNKLNFKLLIISTINKIDKFKEIKYTNVIHKYIYSSEMNDPHFKIKKNHKSVLLKIQNFIDKTGFISEQLYNINIFEDKD